MVKPELDLSSIFGDISFSWMMGWTAVLFLSSAPITQYSSLNLLGRIPGLIVAAPEAVPACGFPSPAGPARSITSVMIRLV